MGYAFAMGTCLACKRVFTFNPLRVPSITVAGSREPVCLSCMTLANAKRKEMGLEPHAIHPDAYEPCEESEL